LFLIVKVARGQQRLCLGHAQICWNGQHQDDPQQSTQDHQAKIFLYHKRQDFMDSLSFGNWWPGIHAFINEQPVWNINLQSLPKVSAKTLWIHCTCNRAHKFLPGLRAIKRVLLTKKVGVALTLQILAFVPVHIHTRQGLVRRQTGLETSMSRPSAWHICRGSLSKGARQFSPAGNFCLPE